MSYSFTFKAANKTEAKAKVSAELDKVAQHQDCHHRDKQQAQAAADAFIDLLVEDETKDVFVSMSGSLSGFWTGSDVTRITGANVSVNASLADKPAT